MAEQAKNSKERGSRSIRHNISRLAIVLLTWIGAAVIYHIIFSLLFDTPAEYKLRHSTDLLRAEYEVLSQRYDSLSMVVDNVIERDRTIFRILFESEPYNFDSDYKQQRVKLHEELLSNSPAKMRRKLISSTDALEQKLDSLERTYTLLQGSLNAMGDDRNRIPSIQPVINHNLTLLTAAYGTLMHPFYRTLQSHQGVDYTIPEGESVFATADGKVKEISGKNSTSGLTIVIDHGNGYTTSYSHLKNEKVKRGQKVRRGDIIAQSGNSGLSLAPHLHYEVRYEGMRVDPIHYFFMELTADEYQRIIKIAQSGMQSFD